MNRPGLSDYIAGNAVTLTAVSGVTAVAMLYCISPQAHHETASWVFPVIGALMCKASLKARRRVAAFRVWERAWNAMSGGAPPPKAARRGGRVRTLLFFIVWSALLCWLASHAAQKDSQAYGGVSFCFLLLSLWAAGGALQRAARWVSRPRSRKSAKPAPEGEFIVSVCPARPWRSPSIRQITAALPKYARELLLTHQSDAPSATSGDAQPASSPLN